MCQRLTEMHFLITGHTGFKGTWLALMLWELGHDVSGISLEPEQHSLFRRTGIEKNLINDLRIDIRNIDNLRVAIPKISPDVVVHLAAQSLVRTGYREPVLTYETNVLGTLNVLEATASTPSIKAQIIVTTDKVYRNEGSKKAFSETDPLGGDDPYSSSKAMADVFTQNWARKNSRPITAVARAGNVIGGGDICQDRLVPDLVNAYSNGLTPNLRFPNSIRPWQHVLDCLNGYISLTSYMLKEHINGIWNFGPDGEELVSVESLAEKMAVTWGVSKNWNLVESQEMKEAPFLTLDSSKSRVLLHWENVYETNEAIAITANWYKRVLAGETPEKVTRDQITEFFEIVSE